MWQVEVEVLPAPIAVKVYARQCLRRRADEKRKEKKQSKLSKYSQAGIVHSIQQEEGPDEDRGKYDVQTESNEEHIRSTIKGFLRS